MTSRVRLWSAARERRYLVPVCLAILGFAAFAVWFYHGARAANADAAKAANAGPPPVPVEAATVAAMPFPNVLNGLGTVQPTNTVLIRSRVDGQVDKVAFEEGKMVQAGDLLVQIDPAPFRAALDQAIAKKAQDEASLLNARQDLQRTTVLSGRGDATLQLLDQRTATVASLVAQVQADAAAIQSAQVQLNYTTIRSPLTGRAGFRLVDPGNIVHASDQTGMLTVTQLQPISVIFTATEQDLPTIREALTKGDLKVTALTSDGRKTLADGSLRLIDNQVDVASGTIRLKAAFANTNDALWPGLSVSTRLLLNTLENVIVVPDTAVQRGPNGLFVYVIDAQSKAQLRNVEVGDTQANQAHITKGLAAGERIITAGTYRVVPGGPVQVLATPPPEPGTAPSETGSTPSPTPHPAPDQPAAQTPGKGQ